MKTFPGFLCWWMVVNSCLVFGGQAPRFNYQARLTDDSGTPLSGNHACVFRLYEGGTAGGADSGTLRYEESVSLSLVNGIANHAIGTGVPNGDALSDSMFRTSSDLYIQTSVDGNIVLPRARLESVPFAINASHADNGELRTALDPGQPGFAAPFVITQPGSYYLAGSFSVSAGDGIDINCSDVTLDLNGFTISSSSNPPSGAGVLIQGNGVHSIVVRNGHIEGQAVPSGSSMIGPGFESGLATGTGVKYARVSDIVVNGVSVAGISIFADDSVSLSAATNCVVSSAYYGIQANTVVNCSADQTIGYGIYGANVSECYGGCTGGGGILSDIVTNSFGLSVSGIGISCANATGCHGKSTSNTGLNVSFNAQNCFGESISGEGLKGYTAVGCDAFTGDNIAMNIAVNATNCFAGNNSTTHPALKVTGTANICGGGNLAGGSPIAIEATVGIGCSLYGGGTNIPAAGKFLGTL